MAPQIYIIRHGETGWSLSGKHTSRTDVPLTPAGEASAFQLATRLHGLNFSIVLSSPRQRAIRTCQLAGLGSAAAIDPDLVEWDYGDDEGLKTSEILQDRPGWNLFRDGCPNGESPAQAQTRADRVLQSLRSRDGNIALFTHGHFGSVLIARWIQLRIIHGQNFPLRTASLSILSANPRHHNTPVISLLNQC
jgi:broad specificity phosphatase PhoE